MEIDKTQLVHDVASTIWGNEDPLGERGTFEEQDKITQFGLKMNVLAVLAPALPVVEKTVKTMVLDKIKSGQDNGLSADEIIWSLEAELNN